MTFHLVNDPDQVRDVLRRDSEFLPHNTLTAVTALRPHALRILSRSGFALPPVLASATGTHHQQMRRIVARFVSPARIAAITPRITAITAERCVAAARALATGLVDLDATISRHVPAMVMQELLGLHVPRLSDLNRWSRDSLELFWGTPTPTRQVELARSAAEFYSWLRRLTAPRRITTDTGMLGTLHATGMSRMEICALAYFLVIAAHETTAQLISTAFHHALQDSDRWAVLHDRDTVRAFVRDILATSSPVTSTRRITKVPTAVGTTMLPAGTELLLRLTCPRDTATTTHTTALAFGHGVHRCLGATLAELEAEIVLAYTAHAFPRLTPHGPPPQWTSSLSFNAPNRVLATLEHR